MKTLTIALVVPLLILAWATGREAQAAPPSASPTLVLAEAPAGDASFPAGGIDPMPDGAVTGAWCLGGATAAILILIDAHSHRDCRAALQRAQRRCCRCSRRRRRRPH